VSIASASPARENAVRPRAQTQERHIHERRRVQAILFQGPLDEVPRLGVVALANRLAGLRVQSEDARPVERLGCFRGTRDHVRRRIADVLEPPTQNANAKVRVGHVAVERLRPRREWREPHVPHRHARRSVEHLDLPRRRLNGRERHHEPPALAADVQSAQVVRLHEPARPLDRHPVLGPAVGRPRREAAVLERRPGAFGCGLAEQAPRLHLHILPVIVRQEPLPDHPLLREAPDPDFLAGLVVARGIAGHAKVAVVPVGAEEVGRLSEHVV
jgi:hypothetical protein